MKFKIFSALFAAISSPAFSQGAMENPAPNSTESGIGIISGWHCSASKVEAFIDGKSIGFGYVGSERGDVTSICGKSNAGYSLLVNFNNFSQGSHNVKMFADGVKFGEANFNTVKSGGVDFLQNTSKQVIVADFPKSGSTATLNWSQSKQSFTVTSITNQAAPTTPTPTTPTGLAKLYGMVTLNYKFTGSSTVYTDSVRFSSANRTSDGQGLVASVIGSQYPIACTTLSAGFQFLCLIANPQSYLDVFAFNVSSGNSISGIYEYCSPSQSASSCASDLVNTPDGTVTGLVNPTATALSINDSNTFQIRTEKHQNKVIQISEIESTPSQISPEAATAEEADEISKKMKAFFNLHQR
jgi:hypothetical protein